MEPWIEYEGAQCWPPKKKRRRKKMNLERKSGG